ncbi:murein L,D-transpeptidase catalytic domain-containing protein [Thiobaca trueperi]|uniref:Lysozyme family protein n=1 Tax=Thiobaca trueperi TaxID=127458 RepID=A0A4R3MZH3_9GAMM|nr:murein L,D-transpeptidase catalytic domain family protein [Thiobaca trueperi]TCT19729.1 lysozyme family protein [Thiobaca trueperi]
MFPQNKIEPLQLALKSLELYEGKIDGIVGPLTLAAIKKFEALALERPTLDKPMPHESAEKPDALNSIIDGQGADIEDALVFTLKNEGGYVDHPLDKGGPTNKGITIRTLSKYLGRKATRDDVKNLNYETIKIIYRKYYWDVLNLDHVLDQGIATALFDMGVLCGTGTASRICQDMLGITQSKKMDLQTLDALNETTDEQFIPAFADRNIRRFEEIVAKNPDQRVFLKGWKNRANRLLSLVNNDDMEADVPASAPQTPIGEGLYDLADQAGVPREDIKKMIDWQAANNPVSNPRYWVVFKIREHSKNKRMYVFDRLDRKVKVVHAVHGTGSDPDNDGVATLFSNVPESKKSSLGLYKTLGTYVMAKHGRALRLEGLESTNNNALKRGIVFHGVPYAGDEYVKQYGRCGRSFGCPAVEYAVVQDLIDKLKGGSLFLIS